ncbi:hypothetical protein N7539_003372 [Penicillium diatomitis]|uniref:Extracellular protein n=1 Tax=Penicillium diatomitis TaxID=2819901 RepID=A0A9W9XD07_9EURO|nr:uncharacterized protein N7539_003372 [Penicillium diatomitis]KAJ5488482.1 hypothetical protein N7539_003372 [Penicillium diatomitis]
MKTTAFCAGLLAVGASAHMQMSKPYPIRSPLNSKSTEQKDYSYTNPLDPSGANYPCKGYANDPFQSQASYSPGGTYEMELDGSAVHGGGSCQISLTYDKGKTFKVIESMLGECPISKKYSFQIPSDAPTGEALLAWSWFNKVGNREMYMNCAMVTIGGSTTQGPNSKPSRVDNEGPQGHGFLDGPLNHTLHGPFGHHGHAGHRPQVPALAPRDMAGNEMAMVFDSLPAMFIANVNQVGGCVTIEGEEVDFPQPGSKVVGKIDTSGKGYKCSGDAPFLSSGSGSGSSSGSTTPASQSTLSSSSPSTSMSTMATSSAAAATSSTMVTSAMSAASSTSKSAPETKGTSVASSSEAAASPTATPSTTQSTSSDSSADDTMISLAQLAELVSSLSSAAARPTANSRVGGNLRYQVASTNAAFSSYVSQWPCGPGDLICSPDGSSWAMCSNGHPVYMGTVARGMSCRLGHMVRS